MSSDRQVVPVSLPSGLVAELDALVEAGLYSSRSDALRYGARLVVHEEWLARDEEEVEDATGDGGTRAGPPRSRRGGGRGRGP